MSRRVMCPGLALLLVPIAFVPTAGCTDLVTVDVGRGEIEAITFERELVVGGGALEGCPTGERPIEPVGALTGTASVTPVETGCLAGVRLERAVLVDEATMLDIADTLEGFDTTALVGFDVEVDALELAGDGVLLDGSIRGLTILLEGDVVLEASEPASLPGDRVALPQSVVDAFLDAVARRTELRVDVEVRVTFRDGARLPDRLRVEMVLQPILRVDVLRAAL